MKIREQSAFGHSHSLAGWETEDKVKAGFDRFCLDFSLKNVPFYFPLFAA